MNAQLITTSQDLVLIGSMRDVAKIIQLLKVIHGEDALIIDILKEMPHAKRIIKASMLD